MRLKDQQPRICGLSSVPLKLEKQTKRNAHQRSHAKKVVSGLMNGWLNEGMDNSAKVTA